MFAIGILDRPGADDVLVGSKVFLRPPTIGDYDVWQRLRRDSRDFLQPWEPLWPPNDPGRYAFRQRLRRQMADRKSDRSRSWFIFTGDDRQLCGGITLGHIRRGVSQSAQIGYWMGEQHAGQGLMTEALALVVEHGFTRCGLHRMEAACIAENERSVRLLKRAGFHQEGTLRSYLKINGEWRDHVLFARINPGVR